MIIFLFYFPWCGRKNQIWMYDIIAVVENQLTDLNEKKTSTLDALDLAWRV